MKILVTDTVDFNFEVPDGAVVVPFDENVPIPSEHLDASVVVGWGRRPSLESLQDMPKLRLIQSLSAGTDVFQAVGVPDGVALASGRGLHDQTVAEHTIALLLALVRQMRDLVHAQDQRRWAQEMRGPKELQEPNRVSSLIGARVLIWGFGSIGQTIAPILTALGSSVQGVARTAGERAGYPVIAAENIRDALPETDVLVMVLPSAADTKNALSADLLDLLPNRSLVCNVGRGSTVDEAALLNALQSGQIAGAALDVTAVEPLPPVSPLWDAPNCLISPHVAGFRAYGADQLMEENLTALLAGTPIKNRVSLP